MKRRRAPGFGLMEVTTLTQSNICRAIMEGCQTKVPRVSEQGMVGRGSEPLFRFV